MRLILASASPRRATLLREAGYTFAVEPADVDESESEGEAAPEYVIRVAALKGRTVAARFPDDIVLAADTTVVVDDVMLAKPADDADAGRMLRLLSGRAHEVLTGVVVIRAGVESSAVVATRVRFRPITPAEMMGYVASGEPHDKAGAYGVQGLAARFVESVEGSYTNVVGLPLSEVRSLLGAAGFAPNGSEQPAGGHAPGPFDRTGACGYSVEGPDFP
jgi:septum formation protein